MPTKSPRIAGERTLDEWTALRKRLAVEPPDEPAWQEAFKDFYHARLQTRYFIPIEALAKTDTKKGEGFMVVAVLCSLVEFLESCERGYNFIYCAKGQKPGPYQYSQHEAGEYFTDFLRTKTPFAAEFTEDSATAFYRQVRCGLLHEARTKGGWLIQWAESNEKRMITFDPLDRVVFRNRLLEAFTGYFADYQRRVMVATATELRAAFLRKFDSLHP